MAILITNKAGTGSSNVSPTTQRFTSTGTTTGWLFTISTSSTVAAGDTYTNNGNTYTVLAALTAQTGQVLFTSGASAPLASGTLARATGSGTSSIAFTSSLALGTYTLPSSPRAPLYLRVKMVAGGGGGGGSGTAGGSNAGIGTNTVFGALLLAASGGTAGGFQLGVGGDGGTGSVSSPAVSVFNVTGGMGGAANATSINNSAVANMGGMGGSSFLGGAGSSGWANVGSSGKANTGGGGGGGGAATNASSTFGGCGGGAGAYVEAVISSPSSTYFYAVGTGGAAGGAGANGTAGGAGGTGIIVVEEYYQ